MTESLGESLAGVDVPNIAPVQAINVDLDSLDLESTKGSYTFKIQGETFTLLDPEDLDWQEVEALDNPLALLDLAFVDGDADRFRDLKLSVRKVRKVFDLYSDFYGLDDPGNADGSSRR